MKYIGFVKEHDSFSFAISFRDTFGDIPNNEDKIIYILNHLKKGVLFLGWMGYAVDIEDKNLIAPDAYYTDGIWAWPIYFPYYIEKYNNIIIDNDFYEYCLQNQSVNVKISDENLLQIENDFIRDSKLK